MRQDIVILTMARSRSSLVSHILYRHGIWTGKCKPPDEFNSVPYHENRAFKRLINQRREKVYDTLIPTVIEDFLPMFFKARKEQGYKEGPWLIKVDAFCWPLFKDLNPIYIKLYRSPEGILDSIQRTTFMQKQGYSIKEWEKIIKAHHDEMDKVEGFKINTDNMLTDYSELKNVIEHIGLEFDYKIPDKVIHLDNIKYEHN